MTELDFDELDRAVNDLMHDVDTTKRPSGLDDPEDKVVELGPQQILRQHLRNQQGGALRVPLLMLQLFRPL